jgi:hypothetical protein
MVLVGRSIATHDITVTIPFAGCRRRDRGQFESTLSNTSSGSDKIVYVEVTGEPPQRRRRSEYPLPNMSTLSATSSPMVGISPLIADLVVDAMDCSQSPSEFAACTIPNVLTGVSPAAAGAVLTAAHGSYHTQMMVMSPRLRHTAASPRDMRTKAKSPPLSPERASLHPRRLFRQPSELLHSIPEEDGIVRPLICAGWP